MAARKPSPSKATTTKSAKKSTTPKTTARKSKTTKKVPARTRTSGKLRVLFAAAEMAPAARVGGLAEATAGLVAALRTKDVEVEVVLPDYGDVELANQEVLALTVPDWVGGASARTGTHAELGELTLITVPGISRPHPYVDVDGSPWPDNDARFFAFSAAVADLANRRTPDVLHLNDWHTAATTSFAPHLPTVLTVHTLGYQGVAHDRWLGCLPFEAYRFAWYGGTNPLAGALALADRVIAVSPNYASEIVTEEHGMGLDARLRDLDNRLIGIRNGIDTDVWNPATDPMLHTPYTAETLEVRQASRRTLADEVGWKTEGDPIIGMVGRLVDQKGIDTMLDACQYLESIGARLVVLGSGQAELSKQLRIFADYQPERVWFFDGYDVELAHRIFAGADFLAMPSRFEPCGLAQMQAMIYGAVPIVNDVGGLRDTVIDANLNPEAGTGFVNRTNDVAGLVDALHRASRAFDAPKSFAQIQLRGMTTDWSWSSPADKHIGIYNDLAL